MEDNYWQDCSVMVTGATGLLGGWLVPQLVKNGADVVCLVRDWVPQSQLLSTDTYSMVKIVRGDICDHQLLERILCEYEVNVVFHLAAQAIVGIANRNPISTFDTNIRGTWSLLEACRHSKLVEAVVCASSDKAYGNQEELPYTEDMPLDGRYPYDVSKSCADIIAQGYAIAYKLPVAITRCGNFYGGGDLNWNRIVPGTIRSILRGKRPVIRSNGKMVRDYFYIEDAVNAYMMLAETLAHDRQINGMAFNFSNDTPLSVNDVVILILKLMGSDLLPMVLNQPLNEIPEQYLSSELAQKTLGWKPQYSIEQGMNKTIDWYQEYFQCPKQQEIKSYV